MPLVSALLIAIDVALIAHAAKTGRFNPWAYVIMALPGFGALAYVTVELAPAWVRGRNGRIATRKLTYAITPLKAYNGLRDELAATDSVYNRVALARECMVLNRNEEALELLQSVVNHPQGDEPNYFFDKARVEYDLARYPAAMTTLETLRKHFPTWQSGEAHLLYACAAENAGFTTKALEEFTAVSKYFLGAEAPVRHALCLKNLGRDGEARAIAQNVIAVLSRAPRHVQRAQAQWRSQAMKILKDLDTPKK